MADFEDVRRIALALPETDEKTSWGHQMFRVKGKGFVWERPLGKSDVARLEASGAEVPDGFIVALRVADEAEKQALIASSPDIYFTIEHFDGYAAVLARLDAMDEQELEEMILDAWLDRAPKRLAAALIAERGLPERP